MATGMIMMTATDDDYIDQITWRYLLRKLITQLHFLANSTSLIKRILHREDMIQATGGILSKKTKYITYMFVLEF